ncbi:SWIM zinc finger family protein [Planctomycetota bacterium]|nr:SWIM zinc finger family protein [Planctomycetota bacterium]
MAEIWTSQRVLDLAPDAASIKAGKTQSNTSKWSNAGQSDTAIWGEAKGSGKKPYQVRIDLRGPAFKCSCPSRKFPCKHSLGLMLIFAEQPDFIPQSSPPEWVTDWLDKREQRSQKQQEKAKTKAAKAADPAAQAKRIKKREANIQAGLDELSRFISDTLSQGLATAQTQSPSYWNEMASRMIDAQAPGLANLVRQLSQSISSGDNWQSQFMHHLSRIHLLIQGYRNLDQLSPETQADLRSYIGWTTTREELLTLPSSPGTYLVVGQTLNEDDRIATLRTWLLNQKTCQPAQILDFGVGNQPPNTSLFVGTSFTSEIIYYPGSYPNRAIIKDQSEPTLINTIPGHLDINQTLNNHTTALAANPLLDSTLFSLASVTAIHTKFKSQSRWCILDQNDNLLPLPPNFRDGWTLLAITGNHPFNIVGEWTGTHLLPLGICFNNAYFAWPKTNQLNQLARVS